MRLSEDTLKAIETSFIEFFGPGDELYLFGSRVDDALKGGDIDLLAKSSLPPADIIRCRTRLGVALAKRLDGRKIDIVLYREGAPVLPIHRTALSEGILICRIQCSKAS